METLNFILKLIQEESIIPILTGVIATFSAIAAISPTPKEGTLAASLYKLVDLLALNIGKAKDKN